MVPPGFEIIANHVHMALSEDLGTGDLTANLIPKSAQSIATITCRDPMIVCGIPWVEMVFRKLDNNINLNWTIQDGSPANPETILCTISGNTQAILTGERTALNFLQTLSATATAVNKYVNAVTGTGVRILDTRKTLPGLRVAQKYAVRCGGGYNHRHGLFDMILIKENHIQAAGSIANALKIAAQHAPIDNIEIEVETIAELSQALTAGAKRILLDDFSLNQLQVAVAENKSHNTQARLEASGGVNLDTVRAIAATGVDDISSGDITKNIRAIDLSLRIIETKY
ncbi:nicotinate-nucleotide pyrophosphorylase [Achromatium sp. WMS2]|nr:nicotinate-nucleotide pyrophosphorylase [Achromatium sp. WMS2]